MKTLNIATLSLSALLLASCADSGPGGVPATKIAIAASSLFTWKELCKRVTITFTDDNGAAHRWGRDEALRLTVTNATPYPNYGCTGNALNNLYSGPENTSAVFWVKSSHTGAVTITASGSGSISATLNLTTEIPTAKRVLGQSTFTAGTANQGGAAAAGTMNRPKGIVTCGTKLFVADELNNRVLGWNTLPTSDGQAADFTLGQSGSTTTTGTGSTAATMNAPTGVACSGTTLYVADQGNRRILGFSPIPSAHAAATFVFGQDNLTTGSLQSTAQSTDVPSALQIFGSGFISASETWNRVMIWNTAPTSTSGPTAPVGAQLPNTVIGQTSFTASGNGTTAAQLKSPQGARLRDGYLVVADTGNNRVLMYDSSGLTTGASGSRRFGRTDLTAGFASGELSGPRAADYDGDHVIVSDSSNNRILIWNGVPTSDGASPALAIGAASIADMGAGSATAIEGGYNQFWIDGENLWVSDFQNHRVLAFPAP